MAKPVQLVFAIRAMWALLAINSITIIAAAVLAPSGRAQLSAFHILVAALVVWLIVSVIRSVSLGKRWARNTYAVIACLAVYGAVANALQSPFGSAPVFVEWALVLAYTGIVVCLFLPTSNAWFQTSVIASAASVAQSVAPVRKPMQVTIAVALMWIVLALNAARLIALFTVRPAGTPPGTDGTFDAFSVLSFLLPIAVIALLIHFVAAGRGWARAVYAIFIGFAAFFSMFGAASGLRSPGGILFLINVISALAILVLLFTSTTNAWFTQRGAERVLRQRPT